MVVDLLFDICYNKIHEPEKQQNMAQKLRPIDSENLGRRTYVALRSALAEGRYTAGERLRLRDLAQELGTSVTPVREAVIQLVRDGALTMKNARDIRVRELTPEEYRELAAIRNALEGLAIERFVVRMTSRQLTALEQLEERHQTALDRGDYRAAISFDRRFMFTIFEAVDMPTLLDTVDRLWLVARPTVGLLYSDEGNASADLGNQTLLSALRNGDAEGAKRARSRQIDDCAEVIFEMMSRDEELAADV